MQTLVAFSAIVGLSFAVYHVERSEIANDDNNYQPYYNQYRRYKLNEVINNIIDNMRRRYDRLDYDDVTPQMYFDNRISPSAEIISKELKDTVSYDAFTNRPTLNIIKYKPNAYPVYVDPHLERIVDYENINDYKTEPKLFNTDKNQPFAYKPLRKIDLMKSNRGDRSNNKQFEKTTIRISSTPKPTKRLSSAEEKEEIIFEDIRQQRQNPNWKPKPKEKYIHQTSEPLSRMAGGDSVHISATRPEKSLYAAALIAAMSLSAFLAVVGFAIGWYTWSKRAKAAANADYPAYGVTGPTSDPNGDGRLAHAAHMYHFQHHKQQILAMERSGLAEDGSVSDPESEDENVEGDYTVYECPGYATTGDMEVKNPLFTDETTPTSAKPDKKSEEKASNKE